MRIMPYMRAAPAYNSPMEKEYVDRAKAIREGILQLRDSL